MGACCLLDQSKPVCSDAARQWAPWLRGGTWEVARSFHLFLAFLLTSYWLPFCFFYVIISSLFLLSPFCVAFVLYNRGLKARIWFGLWSLICIELLILVGWLWFVFIFIFYFLFFTISFESWSCLFLKFGCSIYSTENCENCEKNIESRNFTIY